MRDRIFSFLLPVLAVVVAATQAAADGGDDQFAVASSHYSQQRWQLALNEFDALVRNFPQHRRASEAVFFAGESLMQLGRYQEAGRRYAEFLRREPKHAFRRNSLFRSGEAFYLQNNYEDARGPLEQFAEAYPDDPWLEFAGTYLGNSLIALAEAAQDGDAAKLAAQAETQFRAVLQRFPTSRLADECKYGRARARHLQNDFDGAAADYQTLLASTHATIATQARYHLGSICFAQQDFEQAGEHFMKLITAAPNSSWASAARGPLLICLVRQRRLDDAERTLTHWDKRDRIKDVGLPTIAFVADAAFDAGRLDWARELFEIMAAARDAEDFHARGISGLAWIDHRQGRQADAVERFGQLVAMYPEHKLTPAAAFMRAALLEQIDRKAEAIDAYRLVIDKYAEYEQMPQAMYRVAVLSEMQGDADQALTFYRRLIDEHADDWPSPDEVLFRIAWVLQQTDRPEESLATFQQIYEQYRESRFWHEAAYRLAERDFGAQQYNTTRERLAELLAANPPAKILAHALYLDARAAQAIGGWAEVEKPLARLLAETPDSELRVPAEFWLAEAAYQQDRFDEATQLFTALAEKLPGRTDVWIPTVMLRRAQLLAVERHWPEALEAARAFLTAHPRSKQSQDAYYLIGRCLMAQARFDEARDAFLQAAPRNGGVKNETAAQAQWMIGETYMHQENYEQALPEYFRVEALYAFPRWQAAALLQAGKCYEHIGQPREALVLYRRILTKYPGTTFVEEASQRLREAEIKLRQPTTQG